MTNSSPRAKRHLRQAAYNSEVAKVLAEVKPPRFQWAVVCLFYAGLHYVNAYLYDTTGDVPRNHTERSKLVNQHMGQVYSQYMLLRDESHLARYKMKRHKQTSYEALDNRLEDIRQFVSSAGTFS